jgi:hypothetical protein
MTRLTLLHSGGATRTDHATTPSANAGRSSDRARLLSACLQRGVHLLETGLGLRERAADQPDEEAAEALRLDETAASAVKRLDATTVFAVEDAGQEQAAEPPQLAIRLDCADGGLEGRCPRPGWRIGFATSSTERSRPCARARAH